MTDARAISAQLVDIRNVGTHKVVKLTLHAPEEHALRIMELFGWPTGVNPVPVALARLVDPRESIKMIDEKWPLPEETQPPSPTVSRNTAGEAERRKFSDMSPSQQSGMLCQDTAFQTFVRESYPEHWREAELIGAEGHAEIAAEVVRTLCAVKSRSQITDINAKWREIVSDYRYWQDIPRWVA